MEKNEQFKALSKDMLPLINQMTEVLANYEIKGLVRVVAGSDGYFVFSTADASTECKRLDAESKAQISVNYTEEL